MQCQPRKNNPRIVENWEAIWPGIGHPVSGCLRLAPHDWWYATYIPCVYIDIVIANDANV